MPVKIKAKKYLDELEQAQSEKAPLDRLPIPTPTTLADAAGVSRQTIYSFLSREDHKRVDLDILNAIIAQCRRYGHDTQLTDVLVWTPD